MKEHRYAYCVRNISSSGDITLYFSCCNRCWETLLHKVNDTNVNESCVHVCY